MRKPLNSELHRRLKGIAVALLFILGPIVCVMVLKSLWEWATTEGGAPKIDPMEVTGFSVLIAFLTCSLLQIWKEQTDMRARLHQSVLMDWLAQRFNRAYFSMLGIEGSSASYSSPRARPRRGQRWRRVLRRIGLGPFRRLKAPPRKAKRRWAEWELKAKDELERLCAAGSPQSAFYNFGTDQMCGQMARAVSLVMIDPRSYPHFYAALTSGNDKQDQENGRLFFEAEFSNEANSPKQERLRAGVVNHAERALDGFQMLALRRWKRHLLISSLLVSLGISLAVAAIVALPKQGETQLRSDNSSAAATLPTGKQDSFLDFLKFMHMTVVCGAAGAVLAPLAYDIMAAIRAFGKR
ncbi:MAG: hypothetical protein ACO1TE_00495 [Prosthecobacter sp.]